MATTVRIKMDKQSVNDLKRSSNGPVAQYLTRKAGQVVTAAQVRCPFLTGNLRGSITPELNVSEGVITARVGTNVPYAIFVHEGTSRMAGRPFLRDALDVVF